MSVPKTDDLERNADEALTDLNAKASIRISSVTKNDADIMRVTGKVADKSRRELAALKAFKKAILDNSTDMERLEKEFEDLTNERQTEYAVFRTFLGKTKR